MTGTPLHAVNHDLARHGIRHDLRVRRRSSGVGRNGFARGYVSDSRSATTSRGIGRWMRIDSSAGSCHGTVSVGTFLASPLPDALSSRSVTLFHLIKNPFSSMIRSHVMAFTIQPIRPKVGFPH